MNDEQMIKIAEEAFHDEMSKVSSNTAYYANRISKGLKDIAKSYTKKGNEKAFFKGFGKEKVKQGLKGITKYEGIK